MKIRGLHECGGGFGRCDFRSLLAWLELGVVSGILRWMKISRKAMRGFETESMVWKVSRYLVVET